MSAVTDKVIGLLESIDNKLTQLLENDVISADQINTTSLAAISANMGLLRAGVIQSLNYEKDVQGFEINSNTDLAEFGNVKVRGELRTTAVVRNTQTATAGTFIVSDVADVFIADVAAADATIDVRTNGLITNHIIFVKPDASRVEWMRIEDDGVAITDGYRYTVTRDLDGTGANVFYAGEAFVTRGSATVAGRCAMWGEGFGTDTVGAQWGIDDTSWGGVGSAAYGGWVVLEGTEDDGPYIGIMRREGGTYNDYSLYVCIGELTGFLDYAGSKEYGFGAGEIGDFISWDKLRGLRIQAGGGAAQLTGTYTLIPSLTTSQRDALTVANGLLIYNSTLNKFQGYENSAWTSFT